MKTKLLLPFALLCSVSVSAAQSETSPVDAVPTATRFRVRPLAEVGRLAVPRIDRELVALEDVERERLGLAPRYAVANEVDARPVTHGTVEFLPGDLVLWRLRVRAPGALSINLGFGSYRMPEGGRLLVHAADGSSALRPFTSADDEEHGELWTPILPTDDVVVEATFPLAGLDELGLRLTHVGYGYRGFGEIPDQTQESGSCNVDVVCPIADPWRNEIPAIGVISTGGSTFCTGFMVNNTANDRTPYFMTANHCGIGSGNAASLVVYWNYETSVCGGSPDGSLSQFNTGSFFRSSYSSSDFTLVELDDDPNSAWGITYAGWDRSGADASQAIAIHHPSTDEKRISFEYDPTSTTSYLGGSVPGNGTHVRVLDWDVGTTEPGSSGSPLFDQDHRVIGQLHGGYAACGNDDEDWYGKFSVSWTGGGSPSSRLSDWLDPLGTGATTVDTLGVGLSVQPGGEVVHEGPAGGRFTNPSTVYALANSTTSTLSYSASLGNGTGLLLDGGTSPINDTLDPGEDVQIAVTLAGSAAGLPTGQHTAEVVFEDLTNGITVTANHVFEVGRIVAHEFKMDSDPGWTKQGEWQFGVPQGNVGNYGDPDPTSGFTGSNVMGYDLGGTYANNLGQTHLTTTALDCSELTGTTVTFMRWLNVEQPLYDHAYFRVSTDGVSFSTLWQNGSEITDTNWQEIEFDISAIADGQSTVYLRWTMGNTDSSWDYTGWNLDDVRISGFGPPDTGGSVFVDHRAFMPR